jgi:hypothetical protein
LVQRRGFVGVGSHLPLQIRQSERCVPNSEISPVVLRPM